MTDSLRTRIAAVMYRHTLFRALEQCECGAAFDGFSGRSLDAYAAHVADAVIAELPELTQPVSVEAIGDYRYVCHPCGSSFSFYSSSTMQQFALMHSGSHTPKEADA